MIPLRARDLPERIKPLTIINFSEDQIDWKIPELDNIITLKKSPLCLKFENNGMHFESLIREHFDEMMGTGIEEEASRYLRDSIIAGIIDGEDIITYNNMSLLHFFGTWLGPTINIFARGHAIMNNLHYELFGFHQYHGTQYGQISQDNWTNLLNNCGNNCNHETCLKHAKNKRTDNGTKEILFYKNSHEVFLAYYKYIHLFLMNGDCEMQNLDNN